MMIDTHTHYDDEAFDADRETLLNGLAEKGVGTVVNIGASMRGALDSVRLSEDYPFVYAAVGIHPDYAKDLTEEGMETLKELAGHEKTVAIGEIGLDYYWDASDREIQKYWFKRQLELAISCKLPVVIHSRDAAADTMEIMKEYYEKSQGTLKGVIHCFSYSKEMAAEYIKMGFFIGIGGVSTFKNGKKLREVIEQTVIEHIVLETDCPYLSPEPNRGRRNDSTNLKYVVATVAELKGITAEEVERITAENAKRLYPRLKKALLQSETNCME